MQVVHTHSWALSKKGVECLRQSYPLTHDSGVTAAETATAPPEILFSARVRPSTQKRVREGPAAPDPGATRGCSWLRGVTAAWTRDLCRDAQSRTARPNNKGSTSAGLGVDESGRRRRRIWQSSRLFWHADGDGWAAALRGNEAWKVPEVASPAGECSGRIGMQAISKSQKRRRLHPFQDERASAQRRRSRQTCKRWPFRDIGQTCVAQSG